MVSRLLIATTATLATVCAPRVLAQANGNCSCDPDVAYATVPEFNGPFAWSQTIDVNLGHSPETFVRAAYWQIHGSEPAPGIVAEHAQRLRAWGYWRRTDVINSLGGSTRPKTYSDPWISHAPFTSAPCKVRSRDVGAVMMLFFGCGQAPWFTNCQMGWANTHALGMDTPHPLYGNQHYNARHREFWERELMDARYAGLSFVLPNIYGPDITDGRVDRLREALDNIATSGIASQVRVGMFDDTWGWGNLVNPVPVLANTVAASDQIFQQKWAPYFDRIPRVYWYTIQGRPLLYFYNAGTLGWANSAAVLARLKTLFAARYGVTPWLAVDSFFFLDPGMPAVADSRFVWKTLDAGLPDNKSRSTTNGITLDHAMVKWDDIRNNNVVATPADELHKGPEHLQALMDNSVDADVVVIATWNDIGEGTGIHRNYDYYDKGEWLEPHHFMNIIRASQQGECATPSCVFRNGSGINPTGFDCVTDPALGTTWTTTIATTVNTMQTFVGLGATRAQIPLPSFGGELLIGIVPPPLFAGSATLGNHEIPIPMISTLLGGQIASQGLRVDLANGVPSLVLLNAQDLVLGTP